MTTKCVAHPQLEKFQEHLKFNAPYCVCPSCSGTRHKDDRRKKDCPTCYGKGFICEGDFQELNQELQGIANGYNS